MITDATSTRRMHAGLYLLIGGALLWLAGGNSVITAWIAWLPAIFLLRFARLARPWLGYLGVASAVALSMLVLWRGAIPLPQAPYIAVCMTSGLLAALPYLLDRLLTSSLPTWAATLIFPAGCGGVAFLGAAGSPFGTWGDVAYTQAPIPATARIVALAGTSGLVFLIAWLAATLNALLNFSGRHHAWLPLLAWGITLTSAGAAAALVLRAPAAATKVRVAAIAPGAEAKSMFDACVRGDITCRKNAAQQRQDNLFTQSNLAANAGARLLLWSEGAAETYQTDEAALTERGQRFAKEHSVYLVMALLTIPDDGSHALLDDKLIALTPTGEVAAVYRKNKAVPGEPVRIGDGQLAVFDTPYGRIALSICFDADFPALIRQAGRARADLLFDAAADWPRIANVHATMALFRGMENGVALLRATGTYEQQRIAAVTGTSAIGDPAQSVSGISLIADAGGDILATGDARQAPVIADLMVKGRATPYRAIGEGLPWLCLIFLLAASLWAVRLRQMQRGGGS